VTVATTIIMANLTGFLFHQHIYFLNWWLQATSS